MFVKALLILAGLGAAGGTGIYFYPETLSYAGIKVTDRGQKVTYTIKTEADQTNKQLTCDGRFGKYTAIKLTADREDYQLKAILSCDYAPSKQDLKENPLKATFATKDLVCKAEEESDSKTIKCVYDNKKVSLSESKGHSNSIVITFSEASK
ncbi:hypothetical protein MHLP_01290 [Candidatus Mycoplasma haematolamae str. Purdue]|uniref:Uncharacterized protein n=1 Tax=Mycoplasma haematolamae (strain Purdue) TaxID=1212765 RepID=I7BJ27_MYCHA|nr:hypothetical protein [Candidatus Mycoplasma haematolamae]AFO51838.1 hypothetical protein MHLP_01290 [Candidatus Mycoplasma haematolamae str. Purdue]